jgi:hypothetical protein
MITHLKKGRAKDGIMGNPFRVGNEAVKSVYQLIKDYLSNPPLTFLASPSMVKGFWIKFSPFSRMP